MSARREAYESAWAAFTGTLSAADRSRAEGFGRWLAGLPEAARSAAIAWALNVREPVAGDSARPVDGAAGARQNAARDAALAGVAAMDASGGVDDEAGAAGADDLPGAADELGALVRAGAQVLDEFFRFTVTQPLDAWRAGELGRGRLAPGAELLQLVGLRALVAANEVRPDLTGGLTDEQLGRLNGSGAPSARANAGKLKSAFRDTFRGFHGRNNRNEERRLSCHIKQMQNPR